MEIKNVENESTITIWLWESISIVQENRKLEKVCYDFWFSSSTTLLCQWILSRDSRKTFCDQKLDEVQLMRFLRVSCDYHFWSSSAPPEIR